MTDVVNQPSEEPAARALAFYLPQFHPIPENDRFWGPGFTEWTNVAAARPRFRGHQQPNLPGELGFYDLRLPEVREQQASLARLAGIEGFVYWHYWFAGRRVLERPFTEVLASGAPDLPFALAWANESWTGVWHGAADRVLIDQTYPGPADHDAHFDALESAFHDRRYVRVDGHPLFVVYRPLEIPDLRRTVDRWRQRAERSGLGDLHLVAHLTLRQLHAASWADAFDSAVVVELNLRTPGRVRSRVARYQRSLDVVRSRPRTVHLDRHWRLQVPAEAEELAVHPCVVPNWDNTPRSGDGGRVYLGSRPTLLEQQIRDTVTRIVHKPRSHRLLFIKSWNEWAEGNYLEPDRHHGRGWLEATRRGLRVGPS
ncbi:MAG: glycoside hydrolase family 99-like domain-containing protein [Nitriliruptoraceae bacterium]|nr:glycoside hydrolase family 99-like domain-containing protein [Nitriliruptoraceae bacterium]